MTHCEPCHGTGQIPSSTVPSHSWICSRCHGSGQPMLGISYAGIGSRVTPAPIVAKMELIASILAVRGFVLRSGGAARKVPHVPDTDSADLAFERGCVSVKGRKVIRPITLDSRAMNHAARYHPNWAACDERARSLHARNSLIMLGDQLDDLAAFVVCWTRDAAAVGGTGQALRIASNLGSPVFNLADSTAEARLWSWLGGAS